jgi:Glycosyltransferase family 87
MRSAFWKFVYLASAAVITVQRGVFGFANDYAIFRGSFWNLLHGRDLYALHPEQATDLFKYSPTFAALFAPLSVLPFTAGLFIWNLGSALLFVYAALRLLQPPKSDLLLAIALLPMIRNVQSAQSNTLVAALIVLAFVALENARYWRGAASIALAACIKIFPVAALSLAIPRRNRLRVLLAFFVTGILLLLVPLLFTSPGLLRSAYQSWGALEQREAADYGISAMGLLHEWAGFNGPPWIIQLAGTVLLLLPLAYRWKSWEGSLDLRLRFLASLLVYCVLFNHKAESQSYIIAFTGLGVWYAISQRSPAHHILLGAAIIFGSLISMDITPDVIKASVPQLARKALPFLAVWVMMQVELMLPAPSPAKVGQRDVAPRETLPDNA